MQSKKTTGGSRRTTDTPLICRICGDVARGLNFDVLTCMSCKAFFRRNALEKAKTLQCQLNSDCDIDKYTRGGCSACRLKKCVLLGMNPQLIRSPSINSRADRSVAIRNERIVQPRSVTPIRNDRSTLTFDEWNLLTNILNAYDEQNLLRNTETALKQQSSLPPKLRSKRLHTLDLIGTFYSAIQPFLERSPYFNTLSPAIRRLVFENNLNGTGTLNSMFAAAQAKLFENLSHRVNCNEIYGADYVEENQRLLDRMETNGTLIKIMLIILAFASNSSIVVYEQSTELIDYSSSLTLVRIQEIFITMLWKYLLYQYGFNGAVRRFDDLVKYYLDLLNRMNVNVSRQHWNMVNMIVQRTTRTSTYNQ